MGQNTSRVFVYGTLKRLHTNVAVIDTSGTYLGRDFIEGRYKLVDLGPYPALMEDKDLPVRRIYGEVWEGEQDMLESVDRLEGHPRYYARTKVRPSGRKDKSAWVYLLPAALAEKYPEVDSGLWNPKGDEQEYWERQINGGW